MIYQNGKIEFTFGEGRNHYFLEEFWLQLESVLVFLGAATLHIVHLMF
jgi:hypothetical protein